MTEYDEVVHVDTVEEYRAVLEKWFDKGYGWGYGSSTPYHEEYFTKRRGRYLILDEGDISYSAGKHVRDENLKVTPFKEFMAKELGKVTYDVSVEQMAFIKEAKDSEYPASYLTVHNEKYDKLFSDVGYGTTFERDLLRHIGGDENVVFQLKEPLYLLKGKNNDGDNVYFNLDSGVGAPTYTYVKSEAFKAPFEQIAEWANHFWEPEEVKD